MLELKEWCLKSTRKDVNKVKNNSKSGFKIKHIITLVFVAVVLSTQTQLFIFAQEKIKIANRKQTQPIENIELEEETQIASNYERDMKTVSRSSQQRDVEEKEENRYITIEEIKISKNMDLTKRCGVSKEDFKQLMNNLKVDTSGFFYRNSDTIYDLCEQYELNEIFFCGLIAGESGWNISSNHRKKCNYISMMSKGKLIKYASEKQGLEAAAKLLHTKYLTPGGAFYTGKTLANVQKRFCPKSSTWVNLVYRCMKQVIE